MNWARQFGGNCLSELINEMFVYANEAEYLGSKAGKLLLGFIFHRRMFTTV